MTGAPTPREGWARQTYKKGELVVTEQWNGPASSAIPASVDWQTGVETYAVRSAQLEIRPMNRTGGNADAAF